MSNQVSYPLVPRRIDTVLTSSNQVVYDNDVLTRLDSISLHLEGVLHNHTISTSETISKTATETDNAQHHTPSRTRPSRTLQGASPSS